MTCYYPSGAIADGLLPCNTTAGAVSSCCRVGDVCLTNGYCFSAGQNSLIRRGCTDRTFNSTECPQTCLTGMNPVAILQSFSPPAFSPSSLQAASLNILPLGQGSSVDVVMTPCGDYTYFCCGQDDAARSCCTSGNGTVLVAAGTAIMPTATVTYTNTITGTSSITSCPSIDTSASAALKNCESTNNTVPIAAGLGAALGIAIITAVAFAVMWRKKTNRLEELRRASSFTGR
jgi:hypothetical protein